MPPFVGRGGEDPRQRKTRLQRERRARERERIRSFEELHSISFHDGGPNQAWDPDRWIYGGQVGNQTIADGVRDNISGRNVRIGWIVEAPSQAQYGNEPTGSGRIAVGQISGKASFIRELEGGASLNRMVERVRGWPSGTVTQVFEVSIAESMQP